MDDKGPVPGKKEKKEKKKAPDKDIPTPADARKDRQIKEQTQTSILAKKLQKEAFHNIWEAYKAKENMDRLAKSNVAAHFFYLGAKSAFMQGMKDYGKVKADNKEKKIRQMQVTRKLRDIKRNALKLSKGGLDIDKTIGSLRKALDENREDPDLSKSITDEINFLLEYKDSKHIRSRSSK